MTSDHGTTVWLIRHGLSRSNAGGETADPAMIPLSPVGERQAGLLAGFFDRAPDLIVTSPFLRARQTAEPTIARFPTVPVERWPIEEFTYLGSLHGRPMTGAERRPFVDAYWNAANPSHVDDGWSESFVGVNARARRFLTDLSERNAGRVAAFTHGLFMRVVIWAILTGMTDPDGDAMRRFSPLRTSLLIPNGSIVTLSLHPERGHRVLGGTTAHLPAELRTGG